MITLLLKAMNFAKKLVNINEDKVFIKHARKSFLDDNSEPWIKKDGGLLDVTIGTYDWVEVCEVVGTFLLCKISLKYNKNDLVPYCDDGLAIFKKISCPKSEKFKKDIQKLFKQNELDIVIQYNMKTVKYINIESTHPPSIIKQLQLSIESPFSSSSSAEKIFNNSVIPYQDALDRSGYKHKIKYKANIDTVSNKKQRKRNIIWFNLPYRKNRKTNIGKIFLNPIKKHFPPHHKFHKLFNKNTVKISHSCTRNIKTMENPHNTKILVPKKALNKEHAIA